MPLLKYLWIGALLGFLSGVISNLRNDEVNAFAAGCAAALVGLIVQFTLQYSLLKFDQRNKSFLQNEKKFMEVILKLAAAITKVDGDISEVEKNVIKNRINADFEYVEASRYFALFETYLNQPIHISEVCKEIDYEFDEIAKAQLIYLVVSIAAADGILMDTELDLLKKITRLANIKLGELLAVLKMFEFKREQAREKKSKRKANQPKKRTSLAQLKNAYSLLKVSENASATAIKKAYRKLAKINHPDKVSHLSKGHEKKAKEKFQIISDAYSLIKEKRGIK